MIHIYIESGVNQAKENKKETTNEQDFLVKFIEHHYSSKHNNIDFEVVGFGGKDKLVNNKSLLEMNPPEDVNIVIFDADTPTNQGGFQKRKQEIEAIKQNNGMSFELFLWPNNQDDGDFESLLIDMINANHSCLIECFKQYEMCVRGHDTEESKYITPGRKSMIYTYIETFKKSNPDKEALTKGYWLFDNPNFWNLDASAANPLKQFLDKWLLYQ